MRCEAVTDNAGVECALIVSAYGVPALYTYGWGTCICYGWGRLCKLKPYAPPVNACNPPPSPPMYLRNNTRHPRHTLRHALYIASHDRLLSINMCMHCAHANPSVRKWAKVSACAAVTQIFIGGRVLIYWYVAWGGGGGGGELVLPIGDSVFVYLPPPPLRRRCAFVIDPNHTHEPTSIINN